MAKLGNEKINIAGDKPQPLSGSSQADQTGKADADSGDLITAESNEQQTPAPRRRPQRDPAQVAAGERERQLRLENKPDPNPIIGLPEDNDLPDNLPETEAETETETTDTEAPEGDGFDEDLYVRAKAVGLGRDEIDEHTKAGRLNRIVDRLEQHNFFKQRSEKAPKTEPKPEVKEPEFDEQAFMTKYGITDKNDELLLSAKRGFAAEAKANKLEVRMQELESRDEQRTRDSRRVEIDNAFSSKAMLDKYGDLFGGEVTMSDLEADSREARMRNAIVSEAIAASKLDSELERPLKTRRQYLIEAADSLYGSVLNREDTVKEKVKTDVQGRMHDRRGLYLKKSNARTTPAEPETGDAAALKNIREKMGLKPESEADYNAVTESLLP